MLGKWKSRKSYWINDCEWRSDGWFKIRKYRISGSLILGILGKSNFSTPQKSTMMMLNVYKVPQNESMTHGVNTEPEARDWYAKKYKVKVREYNFAISKKNYKVGATVDGVVEKDGIIEIKCPQNMYYQLLDYSHNEKMYVYDPEQSIDSSDEDDELYETYYNHIFESHYCQMQLGMFVLGRKWADYIVYTKEKKFVQKIWYDENYMKRILKEVDKFYDTTLSKILDKLDVKLLAPPKLVSKEIKKDEKTLKAIHDTYVEQGFVCTCRKNISMQDCLLEKLKFFKERSNKK